MCHHHLVRFPCLSKCYAQESRENREHSLSAVFGQIFISFVFLFCYFVVFFLVTVLSLTMWGVSSLSVFFKSANNNTVVWNNVVKQRETVYLLAELNLWAHAAFVKGKSVSSQSVESSSSLSTVSGSFNNIYAVNSLKACWSCSAKPSPIFWPHANF